MSKVKLIDQLFKVPNNEDGRLFISLLNKYASDGVHVKVRGRKPNHKKIEAAGLKSRFFWAHGPQKFADELGIYLQYKGVKERYNIGASSTNSLRNSNNRLRKEQFNYRDLCHRLDEIDLIIHRVEGK
jgi:hypothetical protein